jgi:hypothetical protein
MRAQLSSNSAPLKFRNDLRMVEIAWLHAWLTLAVLLRLLLSGRLESSGYWRSILMIKAFVISAGTVVLLTAGVCASSIPARAHDRTFWQSIAKHNYSVPHGESADALAPELSTMLGSPDPELRDDLAYSILAHWIHRNDLSTATMASLTDEWTSNLQIGLGESGTNSVLKRSFSALCLSEMAKRETKKPFLGSTRYHALMAQAISYLQAERDLRGYDEDLHWIHATAHTADLLAALAASPILTKEEGATILRAVAARLSTAPQVYTQGEQDRLAAAVVAVVRRNDFEHSTFEAWLPGIQHEDRDVWSSTSLQSLARYQNHQYLLQALVVRLLLETPAQPLEAYRNEVLKLLAER